MIKKNGMKTKDILRGTMRFAWGTTLCITLFGLSSCNDFLEQEPPSNLTPEGFYTTEAQAQAVANQFYQDVMPPSPKLDLWMVHQ